MDSFLSSQVLKAEQQRQSRKDKDSQRKSGGGAESKESAGTGSA